MEKFQNMEYTIILLIILFITIIIQKYNKIKIYKNLKQNLHIILIFFIIGVLWDHFAIWRGHWIFPQEKNIGIKIGLMPIEEYLFIFIIPYFVITIYKIIDIKYRNTFKNVIQKLKKILKI